MRVARASRYPSSNTTSGESMDTADVAKVCHEVNRAYCEALGDTSQPSWEEAPDWQHSSAGSGVAFHMANPDAGPDQSHVEWFREKEAAGWVYGPVKDPEKREHPCMVAYEHLPVEQRAKDYIFRGVVHAPAPYVTPWSRSIRTGSFGVPYVGPADRALKHAATEHRVDVRAPL